MTQRIRPIGLLGAAAIFMAGRGDKGFDESAALRGASTAMPVGDEIWIGTFSGDRVGYLLKP